MMKAGSWGLLESSHPPITVPAWACMMSMDLLGTSLDPYELAELAYEIERVDLQMKGGKQDQYGIPFDGFNFIEFNPREIVVFPLRLGPDVLRDLECHLLLCYTGRTRLSAGVIDRREEYYRQGRSNTVSGLKALYEV